MIRNANLSDEVIIVEYNYNLARETEDLELSKEILLKGVKNILRDPSKGVYYLYEINEHVVGQIMVTYEWSDWRNGFFWWIQSVYVNKEDRNKGIFRELYSHVKELASNKEDVCGLRLYVEFKNKVAQKTYEQLGMKRNDYYMYEYSSIL